MDPLDDFLVTIRNGRVVHDCLIVCGEKKKKTNTLYSRGDSDTHREKERERQSSKPIVGLSFKHHNDNCYMDRHNDR